MIRRRCLILALSAGLGAGLLGGCDRPDGSPAATERRERAAPWVEVRVAQPVPTRLDFERTGLFRYQRQVQISNQEPGLIRELPWFEGDRVGAGATLLQIDDAQLIAELTRARAQSHEARQNLKRMQDLNRKSLAAEEQLAAAQTALAVAEAEEAILRVRLGHTRIEAPFDGIVTARNAQPGDVLPLHAAVLTLVDPASLIAEVQVSDLQLAQLRVGDPVTLRVDALGGQAVAGQIERIHPELDPASHQGRIEIRPASPPAGARAGQFVRADFRGSERQRLLVPAAALQLDRTGQFLYLLRDQKVARAEVRSGIHLGEEVEILEGLETGDEVIVKGLLGLRLGQQVRVHAQP